MVPCIFGRIDWRLLIMLAMLTVLGCPKTKPPAPVLVGPAPEVVEALEADNRRLQQELAQRDDILKEKDALIGRLQLQILERDARYQALADQMTTQQSMLDEAVVEVVRTKAKLRSIESRAEAASTIAEAEISLKGLKESIAAGEGEPGEDYRKAEAMLRMSLDSLVNQDLDLAIKVWHLDDEVDKLQNEAYDRIKQAISDGVNEDIGYMINLLLISRHIERLADHATNIAEEVVYMIEGEIVRHGKLE